jgi:hypothetical protein
MSLLVSNSGAKLMADLILGNATSENLLLKLYTDSTALSRTDTAASRTEASGNGYAAIVLTKGSGWSDVAGSGNNPETSGYAQQTYTFTGGPVTINGYFIVGQTSGTLYWEEAFASPAVIPAGGGTIKITPQFQLE